MEELLGVFTASINSYQHCIRDIVLGTRYSGQAIRPGVGCRSSW